MSTATNYLRQYRKILAKRARELARLEQLEYDAWVKRTNNAINDINAAIRAINNKEKPVSK
jgi:hypothetical protein